MQVETGIKLILGAAIVGAVGYALYLVKKNAGALIAAIPQTVKDGAEASWVLAGNTIHAAADPLDAFGVKPGTFKDGSPKYKIGAPWESGFDLDGIGAKDTVSTNDSGINFNLF